MGGASWTPDDCGQAGLFPEEGDEVGGPAPWFCGSPGGRVTPTEQSVLPSWAPRPVSLFYVEDSVVRF